MISNRGLARAPLVGRSTSHAAEWRASSAAFLLLLLSSVPVRAENAGDFDELSRGVVRVVSTTPEGLRRTGTGIVVKLDGDVAFILTAAHVVRGDYRPKVELRALRTALLAAEKQYEDDKLDAALLTVSGVGGSWAGLRTLDFDTAKVKRGEELWTIGFPSDLPWDVKKLSLSSQEGSQLVLSEKVEEGASGGPLLREGKVVGMITEHAGQRGRAVPAPLLEFALREWIDLGPGAEPVAQQEEQEVSPPPKLPRTYRAGFTDGCPSCPEMVVVPAGKFTMGSPATEAGRDDDEGPQREVTLGQPFGVGKAEVTRGQFRSFVRASGWKPSGGCNFYDGKEWKLDATRNWESPGYAQTDEHPVVCVSHEDAQQYAKWLSQQTKQAYRMLSEEEWEYAARAGTTTFRYWGNSDAEACAYANVADRTGKQKYGWADTSIFGCSDGYAETAPGGRFKANGFALHDVLGNVWEWVEDCYSAGYDKARDCSFRVVRGGGWDYGPQFVRSANRDRDSPDSRVNILGFRVARTLT